MGFRSTFTTQDYPLRWPDWFQEKYRDFITFPPTGVGGIYSRQECKTYGVWTDLEKDIQQAIVWQDHCHNFRFVLVYLHECGGITRVQISKDHIFYSEPDGWSLVEGVTHSYCHGCSDIPVSAVSGGE